MWFIKCSSQSFWADPRLFPFPMFLEFYSRICFLWPIFCGNNEKIVTFRLCLFCAADRELSAETRQEEPNTIWSEFSPGSVLEVWSDGNKPFMESIYFVMFLRCMNYTVFSPINIHFLSFFISFLAHCGGAGKQFPQRLWLRHWRPQWRVILY